MLHSLIKYFLAAWLISTSLLYAQDKEVENDTPTGETTDQPIIIETTPTLENATKKSTAYSSLSLNDVVFKREFTIGLKMHTSGFGLSANFVKIHSIFKKSFYEVEIMDLKHPKEYRQQSLFSSGNRTSRSFVYGKENNFYNLNFSIGRVKSIAEKRGKNGVGVAYSYAFGPSLGIAKPYYLELIYGSEQGSLITTNERYTPENQSLFLNTDLILGSSGFSWGWKGVKFHPGAQARFGMSFDWAAYNEFVKTLEVGAMLNMYLKRIPIILTEDNHFFFTNLYVRLIIGKRW